jgi:uroporphyrinogen decarboxylase
MQGKEMNPREIFAAALALKPAERLPVAVESGGAWALHTSGLTLEKALGLGAAEIAEILYNAYAQAGSDLVWTMSGYNNIVVGALGGVIEFRSKGTPEVITPLLKSPADVDGIDIGRIREDPMVGAMLEATGLLAQKTAGTHFLALTRWGPFTLAGLLYGAENFMRAMRRDKDGVRHILGFTEAVFLNYVQGYIDRGVEIVQLAEPTASGDMISLEHFAEFAVPSFKRVIKVLAEKKVHIALHICGNINDRLDLIAETGATYVSLDYKVDLKRAREHFDRRVAFMGNMDPVSVLQQGTVEEVLAACRDCIERAGPEPGFILAPGCDLPPTTPVANVKAMTGLARGLS